MAEQKTHWRKLHNPDYFGAYVFDEGQADLVVTITAVSKEIIKNSDGKDEEHTIATLKDQKPWILNVTNQKQIEKLFDTPWVEDWIGKSVTLYVTRIRAFGENVDAVRVRKTAPKVAALPTLEPETLKWEKAIAALSAKTTTVEALQSHYLITDANLKTLQDAVA
tara:strand:- start:164 stop:658 length:495 start_codon:yes stop_codon:yes gene_type:complete